MERHYHSGNHGEAWRQCNWRQPNGAITLKNKCWHLSAKERWQQTQENRATVFVPYPCRDEDYIMARIEFFLHTWYYPSNRLLWDIGSSAGQRKPSKSSRCTQRVSPLLNFFLSVPVLRQRQHNHYSFTYT